MRSVVERPTDIGGLAVAIEGVLMRIHDYSFVVALRLSDVSGMNVADWVISRGVRPPGVGVSASRSSRRSTAAAPSSTAARFFVGEWNLCVHTLQVAARFQELRLARTL